MKRVAWIVCATVLTIFLVHDTCLAAGWGPYFSWGTEDPSVGVPDSLLDEAEDFLQELPPAIRPSESEIQRLLDIAKDIDLDAQLDHFTFGVMYDTAPSRDKLCSHRLTLGFDIATNLELESVNVPGFPVVDPASLGVDIDKSSSYGLSIDYTLGFSLMRIELLKWWAGPGVRFNFNYYNLQGPFKAANIGIGGGGETGVNIHITPGISLCISSGIHWNAFGYAVGTEEVGSFVWGNGPFYFVQTSALWHTGRDRNAWIE